MKYKAYNGFRGWKWGVDLAEYDDAFLVLELLNDIRMNSIPAHPERALAEEAGVVAGVAELVEDPSGCCPVSSCRVQLDTGVVA